MNEYEPIHVLVDEAPAGIAADDWEESGLLVSVGHHNRHSPSRQDLLPTLVPLRDVPVVVLHRRRKDLDPRIHERKTAWQLQLEPGAPSLRIEHAHPGPNHPAHH